MAASDRFVATNQAPVNQLELFERSLPERPYCSNEDKGAYPRVLPRNAAVRRRYIQPQPPWLRAWMVFDVDRDGSWSAADDAGLPEPTWRAINRRNGHGHLGYGIDVPVRMEEWGGRTAPAHYLADVERAMTARLEADPLYAGLTCKNPLHRSWTTLWGEHPYSLGELHGWLGDLAEYARSPGEPVTGIGRNVDTFDTVRKWAYRAARQHAVDGGSPDSWRLACTGAAEQYTSQHNPPLHKSECRWIGTSVAKWTWRVIVVGGAPEFTAKQRARGKAGGQASGRVRHEAAVGRAKAIHELREAGLSVREVARVLGVSKTTVVNAAKLSTSGCTNEAKSG